MENSTINSRIIRCKWLSVLAMLTFLCNPQKVQAQCTAPIATASPSSQTICDCSTTSIALSSNIQGTTFSWTAIQTGVSGASAGTGSSIPQTLCTTGSVAGTAIYTITPEANGCVGSSINDTVTVNPMPLANFSYSDTSYCQNASNPSPIFAPGASAGIFSSSPAGLVFVDINTGEIDLALSTPGTYTVTDSVSSNGGCPAVGATTTITINSMDDASFTYSSAIYSQTGIDPTPQITGVQGGTFSSTPSGLAINPATGLINLANCAIGTYTVAYTTNGTCPNTSFLNITITTTVSINENKSSGTLCVYPNPGNGMYYVKSPEGMKSFEVNIKVYNSLGELILTTKTKANVTQIDLSQHPNGIYIIKVNDFSQRLIKQ